MATDTEAHGKGKKRRQRYLPHNKPVKKKGAYPLTPGIEGFFITCDGGREIQAAHEALSVIDTFFEELVSGKGTSANQVGGAPIKALNKKVTFTYSDSSGSEGEEEDDTNDGQNNADADEKNDKKPEKPVLDEAGDEKSAMKEEIQPKEHTHEIQLKEDADGKNDGKPENPVGDEAGDEKSDIKNNEIPAKKDINETTHENEQQAEQPDEDKSDKVEEPPVKKQCCDSRRGNENKKQKSVDELIEAELEELTDKNKRRFLRLESGCNGVVIIRMKTRDGEPGPKEIVQHMMESAASTRRHMSRHILRVLPVEVACYSSDEEISRAITPIIAKHFPVESETAIKFAVLYDARANTGIDRMKIIDAVAKSVPKPHKVDLKDPEKTIVVQVVKTVCLIGVVEKYKELAKYNLRQLTSAKP